MRLAAYQPDNPRNLGALVRIVACMGIPLDVIGPCGFPFSLKAVRRSALDYGDFADMAHHLSWDAYAAGREGRLILLSTKARQSVWDFGFQRGDTLLLGRESAGVPDTVRKGCDEALLVPMPGGGRSLNVAIAAAMALGEAMRQLRQSGTSGRGV